MHHSSYLVLKRLSTSLEACNHLTRAHGSGLFYNEDTSLAEKGLAAYQENACENEQSAADEAGTEGGEVGG